MEEGGAHGHTSGTIRTQLHQREAIRRALSVGHFRSNGEQAKHELILFIKSLTYHSDCGLSDVRSPVSNQNHTKTNDK